MKHLPATTPSSSTSATVRRSPGTGNGLRVHGVYFAAVSLLALALVIVGIAIASMM